jgi:hypothetical protein
MVRIVRIRFHYSVDVPGGRFVKNDSQVFEIPSMLKFRFFDCLSSLISDLSQTVEPDDAVDDEAL